MRSEYKNHILDDSGFFINSSGEILDLLYEGDFRIFCMLGDDKVFMDEVIEDYNPKTQWRRTKYLKSKKQWKAECPGVKDINLYDTQIEAAIRANELAKGSDWIPNQIPKRV